MVNGLLLIRPINLPVAQEIIESNKPIESCFFLFYTCMNVLRGVGASLYGPNSCVETGSSSIKVPVLYNMDPLMLCITLIGVQKQSQSFLDELPSRAHGILYSMNIWRVLYLTNLSFWKFHGYLI